MTRVLLAIALHIACLTLASAAALPGLPDVAPLASLSVAPGQQCNAAEAYLKAHDAYIKNDPRTEAGQIPPLPSEHPALEAILRGLNCEQCEFPFSKDLALPPFKQPIPGAAVYWSAAETFGRRGEELRKTGQFEAAREEFARILTLGLHLYRDPGPTFIQQAVALRVLGRGAEALGELAIELGDGDTAALCARFRAQANAYVTGATRFIKQDLSYDGLVERPGEIGGRLEKIAPLYATTSVAALRGEILLFLGLARPLASDAGAQAAAKAVLDQATRDPDARLQKLAAWALKLDAQQARAELAAVAGGGSGK